MSQITALNIILPITFGLNFSGFCLVSVGIILGITFRFEMFHLIKHLGRAGLMSITNFVQVLRLNLVDRKILRKQLLRNHQ